MFLSVSLLYALGLFPSKPSQFRVFIRTISKGSNKVKLYRADVFSAYLPSIGFAVILRVTACVSVCVYVCVGVWVCVGVCVCVCVRVI